MRRTALYLGALLLLASPSWANPRLAGTLVRMDTKTGLIVIKNDAGQRAIRVQGTAHIEQNGGPSRLGNFHVGDRIQVEIGGTLSNDPLIGVAVYDNATAANLPPPSAPSGVYGQQVGSMATAAGVVNMARPVNAMEGMAMGPNNANLQTMMNQSAMGPGITMPTMGPMAGNNGYPYQPYGQTSQGWQGQGQGQWNQPAPGAFQQPPTTGQWQQGGQGGHWSQNPPQTGPQAPPDQVPAGQAGSGWTSPAMPPAGNVGPNTGWSGNTTPGWSNNGTMGSEGVVDGVIRNIDSARNTIFVAPANGGQTVAVRLSIGTTVSVPLNQIRLGSYVHAVGQMAGGGLVARSVTVQQ
ncbi:MAG TPA: hypothetical protein VGO93_00910 [Candidatus Xenobia bacterium]|jgi:hypothetical protein